MFLFWISFQNQSEYEVKTRTTVWLGLKNGRAESVLVSGWQVETSPHLLLDCAASAPLTRTLLDSAAGHQLRDTKRQEDQLHVSEELPEGSGMLCPESVDVVLLVLLAFMMSDSTI